MQKIRLSAVATSLAVVGLLFVGVGCGDSTTNSNSSTSNSSSGATTAEDISVEEADPTGDKSADEAAASEGLEELEALNDTASDAVDSVEDTDVDSFELEDIEE